MEKKNNNYHNNINNINNNNDNNKKYHKRNFSTNPEEIKNKLNHTLQTNGEITRNIIFEAEQISYKHYPSKSIDYDDFGFLKKYSKQSLNNILNNNEIEVEKSNKRLIKWIKMLNNFSEFKLNHYSKLKSRVRKGIPDSMRSTVWPILAGIDKLRKKDLYKSLVESLEKENKTNNCNDEEVIICDLHRTFPKHYLFMEKLGEGQRALYRVLTCYSLYNKNTGYVQGMGFLTAVFLTYMNEENSFWMLDSLMKNYNMESLYMKNFPGLRKTMYVFLCLLKKFFPKCYELLKINKVYPTMYAWQWFITLYSCVLEFKILVRIFDCVFLEGFKIIYRVALGIFKVKESELLKKRNFEHIMDFFKDFTNDIDKEVLLKECFKISFSRKDIKKYEEIYINNINNNKDEVMILVNF